MTVIVMKRKSSQADAEAFLRNRDVTDVNIRLFHYFLAARDHNSHQDELDLLIDFVSVTAFSSFHLLWRERESAVSSMSFLFSFYRQ